MIGPGSDNFFLKKYFFPKKSIFMAQKSTFVAQKNTSFCPIKVLFFTKKILLFLPPKKYLFTPKKVILADSGAGAASSIFFDLLNSMIYDLKRSVDLRRLFDPVLGLG